MEQIAKLKELVALAEVEAEADKFEKGNNTAGNRLRNAMQEIKATTQDVCTAGYREKEHKVIHR